MPLREVSKVKVIASVALTLLFGSGIVVGMAWERTVSASTPEDVSDETKPERSGERRRMIVEEVSLTAPQKTSIDSLVSFYRDRMSELGQEFRSRYRAEIVDLREEIKEVLTEDQLQMYEALLEENDDRRRARPIQNPRQ